MDQEKISKFIKELRQKEGLTQEKFAEKFGVTYQAVSKWENGKNIPDIAILKQMCEEYDIHLESLLDGKKERRKKPYIFFIFPCILAILLFVILFQNRGDDFEFRSLKATCENFKLFGSIAYNDNKTSIHISNITYCGNEKKEYQKIKCTLYEADGKNKKEIESYEYDKQEPISLAQFLENIQFHIEHYSKSCKMYKENGIHLEIEATNKGGEIEEYLIPLKVEDPCE